MNPRTRLALLVSAPLALALLACDVRESGAGAPLAPPRPVWNEAGAAEAPAARGVVLESELGDGAAPVESGSAGLHLLRRPRALVRGEAVDGPECPDEVEDESPISRLDRRGTSWRAVRLAPHVRLERLSPGGRRTWPLWDRDGDVTSPEERQRLREAAVAAGRVLGPDLLSCRVEPRDDGSWALYATLGPEGLGRLAHIQGRRSVRREERTGRERPMPVHLALVADGVVHGVLSIEDLHLDGTSHVVLLADGLDGSLAHDLLDRLR